MSHRFTKIQSFFGLNYRAKAILHYFYEYCLNLRESENAFDCALTDLVFWLRFRSERKNSATAIKLDYRIDLLKANKKKEQ